MMKVNAETVLKMLLERKNFFFGLLNEIDKYSDGGSELPENAYAACFHEEFDRIADTNEQERWKNAMHPENLESCGLLASRNKERRMMKWQGFVVDMFRHLDKDHLRCLSDPDLESFRRRLNDAAAKLASMQYLAGSGEWHDTERWIFSELDDVYCAISKNTTALRHRSSKLAEIIEQDDFGDLATTERSRRTFEEIRRLYAKTILPTLQFLNENELLKEGATPLQAVETIARIFESAGQFATARRIRNLKTGIGSFAKDIAAIRQSMERYVRQSDEQRMQYNAVEALYNRLKQEVENRQDGKLRSSRIDVQTAFLPSFPHFGCLKQRKFDARTNWQPDQNALFAEYMRVRQQNRVQQPQNYPPAANTDWRRQSEARLREQHARQIEEAVRQFLPLQNTTDLHLALHRHLLQTLSDYTLPDLLDALAWFAIIHGKPPIPQFILKTLHHADHTLRYHPITIESQP